MTMPIEATEHTGPIVIWRKELRPDSGGDGEFRGGLGQIIEIEAAAGHEFDFSAMFDRVNHPAKGRDGGQNGAARIGRARRRHEAQGRRAGSTCRPVAGWCCNCRAVAVIGDPVHSGGGRASGGPVEGLRLRRRQMSYIANRLSVVKPSASMAVSQAAKALRAKGVDVIDLGLGEPDFPTPAHIIEASHAAALAGETLYTAAPGTAALREAIARQVPPRERLRLHS